jgi:hypothetical protein
VAEVTETLLLHSSLEQPDAPIRSVVRMFRKGWRAVVFHHPDEEHSA